MSKTGIIVIATQLALIFASLSAPSLADEMSGVSPEKIADAKTTLSRSLYQTMGRGMAEKLVGRGLEEKEAQRVAKNAYKKYAACIVDVLVTQAAQQQLPIGPILDSMSNFSISQELQTVSDQWDKDATRQALLPCANEVSSEVKSASGE